MNARMETSSGKLVSRFPVQVGRLISISNENS